MNKPAKTKEISAGRVGAYLSRLLGVIMLAQVGAFYNILPLWLCINTVCIALYLFIFHRPANLFFKTAYTLISIAVFALYYRFNFTVEMASAFLMVSAALKLIELKTHRDLYLIVFVMFYMSAVSFIFEQRFTYTVLQLLVMSGCFLVLLDINGGGSTRSLGAHWRSLLKLIGLAAPLVIICFLFFPRIAPLWSIPIKATDGARTGISETMSPGDIAELSQSTERAFRAEFSGAIPDKRDLYWRGLVLDYFDGREWRRSWLQQTPQPPTKIDLGRFLEVDGPSYQVMLEPHQQLWLFALEGSSAASSNVVPLDMGLFNLRTEAMQATRYQMVYRSLENAPESLLSALPTGFQLEGKQRKYSRPMLDLQLPRGTNPQTRQYIDDLSKRFSSKTQLTSHLLSQFREQAFFYTLKPPVLGENLTDEFLFQSKRGFCAHYAGSLAFMLRLADIPARVVVGYQGGELNTAGDYLIVHQYDAHAWVEAYYDKLGWVRLDPTALVAPDRILHSLGQAMQEEGSFLENSPLGAAALNNSLLRWWRLRMDEMNYRWQKWVVNYGETQQIGIIENILGEYSLSRIIWFFTALFALISAVLFWLVWRGNHKTAYNPEQRRYLRWLWVMKRFGYERQVGESPLNYLKRVKLNEAPPKLVEVTQQKTDKLLHNEYQS